MKLINKEFSMSPDGKQLMIHGENGARIYCEQDKEFTNEVFDIIKVDYPKAYDELATFFKRSAQNKEYFKFIVSRQFLCCRYGNSDNVADLDENGNFHSEYVHCAIRPACPMKCVVCESTITTKLSEGEREVLMYLYNGYSEEAIAEKRGSKVSTATKQIYNGYAKLEVTSKGDFMALANVKELFK